MKLVKGQNKFRVMSKPVMGYEYWNTENKPVRLHAYPDTMPDDIRWDTDKSGKKVQSKIKHFWCFVVWNYRAEQDGESKEWRGRIQILELTQGSIQQQLNDIVSNEDWGPPQDYDITVTATGDGLERKYSAQPSPHKDAPEEAKTTFKSLVINLDALFDGSDPYVAA